MATPHRHRLIRTPLACQRAAAPPNAEQQRQIEEEQQRQIEELQKTVQDQQKQINELQQDIIEVFKIVATFNEDFAKVKERMHQVEQRLDDALLEKGDMPQ